jgi:hypothetical protein
LVLRIALEREKKEAGKREVGLLRMEGQEGYRKEDWLV